MSPRTLIPLLALSVLSGCGNTDAPQAIVPTAKPASTPAEATIEEPEAAEAEPHGVNEADTSEQPAEEAQQAEYQPPFPNRENLFLAPKRSAAHTNTPGTVEQSVELLGFANVEGPRVILSINGNVVPIPEGGQEAGIEVISIQPPAVVLQRDRERWQATLEN